MPNLVALSITILAYVFYIRLSAGKMGPSPRVPLSRSLEIVESDKDRSATCDFLFVNSDRPISHRKLFILPIHLTLPPTGVTVGRFCNGSWDQK